MRWLLAVLVLVLLGLQARLWVGDGSLAEVQGLREEIAAQKAQLQRLRARNLTLEAEVLDLREGLDALEERARSELGMIKQGEIFLQVIERPGEDRSAASSFSVEDGPQADSGTRRGEAGENPPPTGPSAEARGAP